jgi:hypothetical protein
VTGMVETGAVADSEVARAVVVDSEGLVAAILAVAGRAATGRPA